MQLDGKRFFYVNPLEVNPGISGVLSGYGHVLPERPGWYACACCPPNLVRFIMSLGKYAWGENQDTLFSHLYIGGQLDSSFGKVHVQSAYPWEGKVSYRFEPEEKPFFTFAVRIPSFIRECTITLNGQEITPGRIQEGYCYFTRQWKKDDCLSLSFDLPVRKIYCHPAVRDNENCVALMRGPMVYCFEGVDHEAPLQTLRISRTASFSPMRCQEGVLQGMILLTGDGCAVSCDDDALYSEKRPERVPVQLKAIPYFAWANRGKNQMRVWMPEE